MPKTAFEPCLPTSERDEIERLLAEMDSALNQLDEMAERGC
jgi:hypothetical protein